MLLMLRYAIFAYDMLHYALFAVARYASYKALIDTLHIAADYYFIIYYYIAAAATLRLRYGVYAGAIQDDMLMMPLLRWRY